MCVFSAVCVCFDKCLLVFVCNSVFVRVFVCFVFL